MLHNFSQDIFKGLSASPKYLQSKYFYDAEGDRLFQQIMELEEYYPTDCEENIFRTYKDKLLFFFHNSHTPFLLTELGAGDGMKTKILLEHFQAKGASFSYLPIDISANVLKMLESDLSDVIPELEIRSYSGEYFQALHEMNKQEKGRKVLLFLGSTIGNFEYPAAIKFLQSLYQSMSAHDLLFIGFDLKKDPQVILKAYNDPKGITEQFNLNLLRRINRELGGDFHPEFFFHYPTYDPITGEAKSYLISRKAHEVHIRALKTTFHFNKDEPIFMEVSQKYDEQMINDLAFHSGFNPLHNFYDDRKYFVDSLWEKKY